MDPVNSNIFFNNTGKFESSIHSFEDLLKKYNKNKNHLMSIFPDLGNIPKEREQLKLIMNSFKRIGYVVHIALPAHDCKEVK
ncbi:MAG: hypothetical protein SVW57_14285, partial [Thermodesulfobacteriota bacterium]|nr:hypothetical protein [Thermodesulfobacteriota bacterium]